MSKLPKTVRITFDLHTELQMDLHKCERRIAFRSRYERSWSSLIEELLDLDYTPQIKHVGEYKILELLHSETMTAAKSALQALSGVDHVNSVVTSSCMEPMVVEASLHVKVDDNEQPISQIANRNNADVIDTFSDGSALLQSRDRSTDALALQEAVTDLAQDETSYPLLCVGLEPLSNSDLTKDQWHLKNTGFHRGSTEGFKPLADARVLDAWHVLGNKGSSDITVAVIDKWFDLSHPEYKNKVVTPKHSGRKFGPAHGTACAGLAIANDTGIGVSGCAPNCKFMPIELDAISHDSVRNAFHHAVENGADVICCAWKASPAVFDLPSYLSKTIHDAALNGRTNKKGCVILFAAGNDARPFNSDSRRNGFALHPDVVAVGACTSEDEKPTYASYGEDLWVVAPSNGERTAGLLTTDTVGTSGRTETDYNYNFGGTSAATAVAAGVCALILSANPELTSREVKEILRDSARRIPEVGYQMKYAGYGCINAVDAVQHAFNLIRKT